jgi:glycosyltransferase involved in cell wall biosynthesis
VKTRSDLPLVSVILTTRDRPGLLGTALRCYQQQTYPRRELIVVDDGAARPADPRAVEAAGGGLLRLEPGTPLGTKLNRGLERARGRFCQKMDDDDWYAPAFLETMVTSLLASWSETCRPTVAFLMPFLFFDVARWEVRQSVSNNIPGATLLFGREDWSERAFRSLTQHEDIWFLHDQTRAGARPLPVPAPETFLAVRHRGGLHDRGHTWEVQSNGRTLEAYLLDRPIYPGGPEALLPAWALDFYAGLRAELLAAAPRPADLVQ